MDIRPIGVFDSGLGGLTAVKKMFEVLPGEDIIYLGDTGRVPYGSKSRETIVKYARQDAAFLRSFDIKAMVVACNTVSSTALEELKESLDIPVFGVVSAPVMRAASITENGRIGIIGTEATIRSGAYKRLLSRYAPGAAVIQKACPLFVPLVENGRTKVGDIVVETVAREYLEELSEKDIDTLILGCTHYPLLYNVISRTMGPGVSLVDSGAETALLVSGELGQSNLLNGKNKGGDARYFVTDSIEGFSKLASLFLESDVRGAVKQVSLDNY